MEDEKPKHLIISNLILIVCMVMTDIIAQKTVMEKQLEQKVATLASTYQYVVNGLSVGVTISQGKPKLVVNLEASKSEGMDLSGQMLRMAEVIQ